MGFYGALHIQKADADTKLSVWIKVTSQLLLTLVQCHSARYSAGASSWPLLPSDWPTLSQIWPLIGHTRQPPHYLFLYYPKLQIQCHISAGEQPAKQQFTLAFTLSCHFIVEKLKCSHFTISLSNDAICN